MQLRINGKPHILDVVTVAAMVEALSLDPRRVAIERNREIVPRSTYDTALLCEGDEIEIVGFIGGG